MGDRCRTSSARFGTRCVCGPSPRTHPLFCFLSLTTIPVADTPVCFSSLIRNIIIKTCLKTSGATSAPCQKDTSRTLHAVTLACSSTYTLSSPTHPSAKSPCFGRTLILMIDHSITHYLLYRLCIYPKCHPKYLSCCCSCTRISVFLFSDISLLW